MIAQNDGTLLKFFVKNTALRNKVLIIAFMEDEYYFEGLKTLQEIGIMKKLEEEQYSDLVNRNILIFEQSDLNTAIDLCCNEAGGDRPYIQVWQNGEVVHENT